MSKPEMPLSQSLGYAVNEVESSESSPTSIAFDLQLSLMDFPEDPPDLLPRFSESMRAIIIECGRIWDLDRLAGVTVGFDFNAALASVELGYASSKAKQYTNNENLLCVAKALRVTRGEKVMSHVVFNAAFLTPLIDETNKDVLFSIHLIAHEFAHVVELKWRDEAMPGVLLQTETDGGVEAMLRESACVIWEEYAACRLAARFGDHEKEKMRYAETYTKSVSTAVERAKGGIKAYRKHHDINKLLSDAGMPLLESLKLSGYLLGHLDGIESNDQLEKLPVLQSNAVYRQMTIELRTALRNIWDTRPSWEWPTIFDALVAVTARLYAHVGMTFSNTPGGGIHVSVPYRQDTMPDA